MGNAINEYKYEDIKPGMEESFSVQVTKKMMNHFLAITGDVNPLHNDEDYARGKGYPDRVVYGMLTASFLSTLAGVYIPGKSSIIHNVQIEFHKPVFPGDKLEVKGKVVDKNDLFQMFFLKVVIENQDGEKVCRGKMQIGVK